MPKHILVLRRKQGQFLLAGDFLGEEGRKLLRRQLRTRERHALHVDPKIPAISAGQVRFPQPPQQLHARRVVGRGEHGVRSARDKNGICAGVCVKSDMMAVATSDGRKRKGHDEKAVAANRERDVITVAEHDDAGHDAELEGGVGTVLEVEGGVRGIVLNGGVVAVKVVCGGEGGSLLHAQFLLVLVVEQTDVVVRRETTVLREGKEGEVILQEDDQFVGLVEAGGFVLAGGGDHGGEAALLRGREGARADFAEGVSTGEEERKRVDGFAGDEEMGDEVGVVAGHGVLDDGVEGVAGGVVEEETDEDDQERVEDVVGEIHVLCIDADFVCLSTRGMKRSTRDGSVEECNLDSGAV